MHEQDLPLTGERTLPGIAVENYWFRRHEVVYDAIAPWCRGALVVDAGVGEGYGAASLARTAAGVIGLDYDTDAAVHAHRRYGLPVVRTNLASLPVRDGTIDVVVNLQVIEHLWDQPGFLAEVRRVLRPGGTLIMSTPNRLTFSPEGTTNPYHFRELDPGELAGLVEDAGFAVTRHLGLRHGPRLREFDRRHSGSIVQAQLAAPAESWSDTLRADVAAVTAADFVLDEEELATSLDLLIVATVDAG